MFTATRHRHNSYELKVDLRKGPNLCENMQGYLAKVLQICVHPVTKRSISLQ